MLHRVSLVLLLLLVSACAHAPSSSSCMALAGGTRFCLLPPDALPVNEAPRLVHIRGKDFDQHMISRIAVAKGRLTLVSSSLLGQPLFEIHYTMDANHRARIEVKPANTPIRARWLLAMLQLSLSDVTAVNEALSGAQLKTAGTTRVLVHDAKEIMRIETLPDGIAIDVPEQALHIRVRELATPGEPQ